MIHWNIQFIKIHFDTWSVFFNQLFSQKKICFFILIKNQRFCQVRLVCQFNQLSLSKSLQISSSPITTMTPSFNAERLFRM